MGKRESAKRYYLENREKILEKKKINMDKMLRSQRKNLKRRRAIYENHLEGAELLFEKVKVMFI